MNSSSTMSFFFASGSKGRLIQGRLLNSATTLLVAVAISAIPRIGTSSAPLRFASCDV